MAELRSSGESSLFFLVIGYDWVVPRYQVHIIDEQLTRAIWFEVHQSYVSISRDIAIASFSQQITECRPMMDKAAMNDFSKTR